MTKRILVNLELQVKNLVISENWEDARDIIRNSDEKGVVLEVSNDKVLSCIRVGSLSNCYSEVLGKPLADVARYFRKVRCSIQAQDAVDKAEKHLKRCLEAERILRVELSR